MTGSLLGKRINYNFTSAYTICMQLSNFSYFQTPPSNYKRQIDIQYGSLPRQQFLSNGSNGGTFAVVDNNANPQKRGVAFGRNSSLQHLHMVMGGGRMRGFSVPNLGDIAPVTIDVAASDFFSFFFQLQFADDMIS